ncbi:hypothetical protein [Candidatus Phycosocius spiralis]|uniref:Glycosyltransferase RgtA/B/C/D-like domain-containing protein n=1 Tax=Candidatus Phycosocius spiralis TaxID=2815099 RepID=A0ABQ4PXG2_9PROT|nr:hypothetical protein [Candidatus Phycosocius spiralis]GIU67751.1 hypothetical protein PsB1_1905 [Candidatus Phycosocius spiralis]
MSANSPANPKYPTLNPMRVELLLRLILVGGFALAAFHFLPPYWAKVSVWNLVDNDDAMRILQVRDWLAGQAWFDVSQHRLTAHPVSNIHWSRIADLPLAATMVVAQAFVGPTLGEKIAVFLTPVWLGVVYLIIATRAAMALGGQKALIPAILLISCGSAAIFYFQPGRVDHHGLQLIFVATALWSLFAGSHRMAALCGIAIALGIAVGLEALPLQLVLIAWVTVRWGLRGQDVAKETRWFGLGLAITLAIAFVATVPVTAWSAPINDAIGRGHVVLGFVGGSLLALVTLLPRSGLTKRWVLLALIGGIVGGGLYFFPELIVPPYAQIDPLLTRLWLHNVAETAPLIRAKHSISFAFALFPCLASLASIAALIWAKGLERDRWVLAALTLFVATALALFWQSRTAGLAMTASGIMSAALIGKLISHAKLKQALLVALVLNPIIPGFVGAKIGELYEPKSTRVKTGGGAGCYTQRAFMALSNAKPGLVLAPIDMGARLLLTTNHRVLAAPYHRNNVGNLAAYRLFMAKPVAAGRQVRAMGIDYVAICARSAENNILSREAPDGLMAALRSGKPPAWLEPIPQTKGSDVQAFIVKGS